MFLEAIKRSEDGKTVYEIVRKQPKNGSSVDVTKKKGLTEQAGG
jgi:hypothetical protein